MKIEDVKNFFFDPLSGQRMRDPYQNTCGHVFEKSQIEGWRGKKVQNNGAVNCPLCKSPLGNLIRNRLIKAALDIVYDPRNAKAHTVEDLTDEEQDKIREVRKMIIQRRQEDHNKGIPDKIPELETFLTKARDFSKPCC